MQQSTGSEKEQQLGSLRDRIARLEQEAIEQQGGKPNTPKTVAEPKVALFTLIPQMRGAGQVANISISADTDYVSMQLELEPSDFTVYRAELKVLPGSEAVWRSRRLRAEAGAGGRVLVVTVRAALLKSQRYQMEAYGISGGASELIGSYPFRVVKQ